MVAYNNHKLRKETAIVNTNEDSNNTNQERFSDLQAKDGTSNQEIPEMQIQER